MKKGTNQLFLYEIRHQPKRTKTNAWKVSIGHGHRWHSQSRSHHAVVNHEWLYARPVIDEGQQYGTDREIITISLLWTQPLILWIEDAQQTPQGLARAVPNAKRSPAVTPCQTTRPQKQQEIFYAVNLGRSCLKSDHTTDATSKGGVKLCFECEWDTSGGMYVFIIWQKQD